MRHTMMMSDSENDSKSRATHLSLVEGSGLDFSLLLKSVNDISV